MTYHQRKKIEKRAWTCVAVAGCTLIVTIIGIVSIIAQTQPTF